MRARFCVIHARRLAVIEMAEASGLVLLDESERDPLVAGTYGTGELILKAARAGARHLIVGVGGSATCDGGAGLAAALGVRFFDALGRTFVPTGGTLRAISRIDAGGLDPVLKGARVEAVCDVNNQLLGPRGSARVFAPQKGATPRQVEELVAGLSHYARILVRDVGKDVRRLRGGGAGGGLPAALCAFLGAVIRPGAWVVLEAAQLERRVAGADLVLTGEGRIDEQTLFGKAPACVAALAKGKGVPCIGFAGSVRGDPAAFRRAGFAAIHPIRTGRTSTREAMAKAAPLLAAVVESAVRTFLSARKGGVPGLPPFSAATRRRRKCLPQQGV